MRLMHFVTFIGGLALAGCSKGTTPTNAGPSSYENIGGDPSAPIAQVGNTITTIGGVKVGKEEVNIGAKLTVTKNEGGLATVHVVADLTGDPRLAKLNGLLPASVKNAAGKVETDVKFRVTTEGVQDFFNKDGAQHTLVKYADAVGTTYPLTKSNGVTIQRTVVGKSDQDDFPYAGFAIKTITVEQDSRVPGIKKFTIRANHRFGIVYFEVLADDGTVMSVYLRSAST